MKIVFWNKEQNCGMTSNMLVFAVFLVYRKGCRITFFELAGEKHGIKSYFREPCEKYHKSYIETLIERHLYYISEANWKRRQKKRKMRNGKLFQPSILREIRYIEANMDVILIHLGDREDDEAKRIIREADVFIVNVKQEESGFETFFAQYANLSEHIFFLIGNYSEGTTLQKSYFSNKYRISENEIGVIPFHSEWQYLLKQKKLENYIGRRDKEKMSGKKYYFLREVEASIEKIWSMAQLSCNK